MPTKKELTAAVSIPSGVNQGVSSAKQVTMLGLLGNPRTSYSEQCQPIENPALAKIVVFEDVGPFKVRGLKPAVDSLREVMRDVAAEQPDAHAVLGTAG